MVRKKLGGFVAKNYRYCFSDIREMKKRFPHLLYNPSILDISGMEIHRDLPEIQKFGKIEIHCRLPFSKILFPKIATLEAYYAFRVKFLGGLGDLPEFKVFLNGTLLDASDYTDFDECGLTLRENLLQAENSLTIEFPDTFFFMSCKQVLLYHLFEDGTCDAQDEYEGYFGKDA
jgi:hypothetical protein